MTETHLGRIVCLGALVGLCITPLLCGVSISIWLEQMYNFTLVAGNYIGFCYVLLCVGDIYNIRRNHSENLKNDNHRVVPFKVNHLQEHKYNECEYETTEVISQ
ncbi:MAG: hypothetical protein ACTSWQ_00440 [Candidatus Thorarchaeota archaeon]